MAAWIPLIKTALPYVVQVVSVAIPAFTARSENKKTDDIVPEQIAELQTAVTQNASSVKILAEQLKGTIEGIDAAAEKLQQELVSLRRQNIIAIVVAAVSLLIALWSLLR